MLMIGAGVTREALRIEGLGLRRGGRRIIQDAHASAQSGMAVALGGANGVGKTSLLRCLGGFLPAVEGAVICALPCHFLGATDGLKARLSVAEARRDMRALYGDTPSIFAEFGLAEFGLADHADCAIGSLSSGQRRRLALARLLCGARPLWLLDEPYATLDSAGRALLDALVATHLHNGGLVIAATHEPLGFTTQAWRIADGRLLMGGA